MSTSRSSIKVNGSRSRSQEQKGQTSVTTYKHSRVVCLPLTGNLVLITLIIIVTIVVVVGAVVYRQSIGLVIDMARVQLSPTPCTTSNLEQVANRLCAHANSASYPQLDGKWVVAYLAWVTGWRPSVADWDGGVSASCTARLIVC